MTIKIETVSVIIIKPKSRMRIELVLAGLLQQTIPAWEIIVAEKASDRTPEMIDTKLGRVPLRFMTFSDANIATMINNAVKETTGSVVALLQGDTVPCTGWIEAIINGLSRKLPPQVLQGPITNADSGHPFHADLNNLETNHLGNPKTIAPPGYSDILSDQNFAIRRDLINRFQMPFDERLETGIQIEFYWKLRQAKVGIEYVNDMAVKQYREHHLRSSLSGWYNFGFSVAQIKKIHDDFWIEALLPLKSFPDGFNWFIRVLFRPGNRIQIKRLIAKQKWPEAIFFYPLVALQRTVFAGGLLKGQKRALPAYKKPVTPFDLQIFITNKCNLRCRHCFFHANIEGTPYEMKSQHLKEMVKSLNRDLRTVSLVGGEPFLCKDLVDITRVFAKDIHLKNIYIITNGFETSNITATVQDILKNEPLNLFIRVSLDGLQVTHNRIRRHSDSFQNAVKTVNALSKVAENNHHLHIEVETTINRENFNELESLAKFVAEELGVFQAFAITRDSTMFFQSSGYLMDSYGTTDQSLLLTPQQLLETEGRLKRIYKRYVVTGLLDRYQTDFHLRLIRFSCQQSLQKKRLLPCAAGDSIVTILPNYDVSLCEMTQPIGNLADFDYDLLQLMTECFGSRLKNIREACFCANPCAHSPNILTSGTHFDH